MEAKEVKEKKTTVAVRLSSAERNMVKAISDSKNCNQSDVFRKAIRAYYKSIQEVNEVRERLKDSAEVKLLKEHPLSQKVQSSGLEIHDKDGKHLTTITSMKALLDFIKDKVFYDPK